MFVIFSIFNLILIFFFLKINHEYYVSGTDNQISHTLSSFERIDTDLFKDIREIDTQSLLRRFSSGEATFNSPRTKPQSATLFYCSLHK